MEEIGKGLVIGGRKAQIIFEHFKQKSNKMFQVVIIHVCRDTGVCTWIQETMLFWVIGQDGTDKASIGANHWKESTHDLSILRRKSTKNL